MNKKEYTDVALVIPAYNEGSAIFHTIQQIPDRYSKIICVDDGSKDDTYEQIKRTRAVVVRHPLNLGQGAALQTAIEYALRDPDIKYFVTFDADGQHRIEDVESMLKIIREKKVDVALGSRFLGKTENINRSKKILLKLAVRFSNASSGLKLTDAHNGLRVFSRKVADNLYITMPDFAHASEIIERIAEKKYTYVEVPVTIVYTDYSKAKGQSMINAVNISFDVLLNRIFKK